jgi:hypothetical protein
MMPHGVSLASLAMALALLWMPARAQPALPPACGAPDTPLAKLIAWVAAEGRPSTLPATILGVPGGGDVAVSQKAYRNPATHLVHAVDLDLAEGRCEIVFVSDDLGNVTTWVTDASGAIERTFHLSPRGNELVPNERYVSEYESIKSYFLERTPEDYAQ